MISQKFEIIRRVESGESPKEVITSYKITSSTIYDTKKWRDEL
jgi:uncharacterized protein (DUF433 family)